ncbi:MAG: response regulator [Lachnospiraceae bacterium]|jgi:two-component system response regulator YesN|nr:response regulator [Lachnospiraceae bacterium]MCH4069937.1 response regulator [Lachnospiraceae bacterium]MCH4108712.1 response regulator [Lachnospiraceae bacterium]MCI1332430.1 response regulator [Lachnospiraceae bacterium]MCI1361817.1 response regulator [Lachnospiraceae bacterium]
MINFLIVDDEKIIRESIKAMLQNSFNGYDIHFLEAENGKEALEILLSTQTDLLLTDIKMPGFSGIDLLHEIQKRRMEIEVIVLSGFDDYSLVRSAMKLGAADYLLKPIVNEEFISVITNCLQKVIHKKDYEKQYSEIPVIRNDDLFHSQYKLNSILNDKYQTDQSCSSQSSSVLIMVDLSQSKQRSSLQNEQWYARSKAAFRSLAKDNNGTLLCMGEFNRYWIIIFTDISEKIYTIIQPFLAECAKQEYKACCSAIFSLDAIQEAVSECKSRIDHLFFNLPQLYPQTAEKHPYPKHFSQLENAICTNSKSAFSFWLNDLGIVINSERNHINVTSVKKLFSDFVYLIMQRQPVYIRIISKYKLTENDILLQISNAFTLSELINSVSQTFCLYMDETADDGRVSENDNIYRAKEYMLSHYSEDLSLNDVADHLGLHPNYLSAVFRKKTGVTFIEYLREVRIEAAKSLLKTTNLKLYEIAEKTGYQNAVQFNRAFKKETGISPSDYRINR